MKKRTVSILLTVLIIISSASSGLCVFADSEESIDFSCGIDVKATLDISAKTLTVSGSGDMCFFYNVNAPWFSYAEDIQTIIIENGVTLIAENAFLNCNIDRITIPDSLETIEIHGLGLGAVNEIIISENSRLEDFYIDDYFRATAWYIRQPDGPVYLGRTLLDYKGTMPENTVVSVKEGTYAISNKAFYNQSNMTGIVVPNSVERIGNYALYGTTWLNNQPKYEVLYLGKVLYSYNHPWKALTSSDIKEELVIPEGIVSISDGSFFSRCVFKNIVIPSSVEHIGQEAFYQCSYLENISFSASSGLKHIDKLAFYNCRLLNELVFPESLERIDISAFLSCDIIKVVYIPANVRYIGLSAFDLNTLDSFSVSSDNAFFSSDDNGILYNKDKTVIKASFQKLTVDTLTIADTVEKLDYQALCKIGVKNIVLPNTVKTISFEAFSDSAIESIVIPYGVEYIGGYAFARCKQLKEIVIPKSVRLLEAYVFKSCYVLEKVIIPPDVKYISGTAFESSTDVAIYCFSDTAAHYYATEKKIPYFLFETPDTARLDGLLNEYKTLNRNKYLSNSLVSLDNAVSNVDFTITVITQQMVDDWVLSIEQAMNNLDYISADYYSVNQAISRAQGINQSHYTADSLLTLENAVNAVVFNLDITEQIRVNSYAKAINDALNALVYLPADYSVVHEAIEQYNSIDIEMWSSSSLTALMQKVQAVNYDLNILEQQRVNDYAADILRAIEALEYDRVVLRNEPNSIIVSATTKEIRKQTALAVELTDPSDFEGSNFAVGGTIVSMNFYNISLLLGGEKTQPNGSVTVKIKLADGVDPEKCKVYHVSDDAVDPLVRIANTLDGNYIVFETDHFSEFAIIEVESALTGLSVSHKPHKTDYFIGEPLSLGGLEISATMSDGSVVAISDYEIGMVDMNTIGEKTVNVYYTKGTVTKTASFLINISYPDDTIFVTNAEISSPEPLAYLRSAQMVLNVTPGAEPYTVKWTSSNISIATVDENGVVKAVGSGSVTISAEITNSDGTVVTAHTQIICTMTLWQRIIVLIQKLFSILLLK